MQISAEIIEARYSVDIPTAKRWKSVIENHRHDSRWFRDMWQHRHKSAYFRFIGDCYEQHLQSLAQLQNEINAKTDAQAERVLLRATIATATSRRKGEMGGAGCERADSLCCVAIRN